MSNLNEMSRYLMKGWIMTSVPCQACSTTLLKKKGTPSSYLCVSCNKVTDSSGNHISGDAAHPLSPTADDVIDAKEDSAAFLRASERHTMPPGEMSPSDSDADDGKGPVVTVKKPSSQPEPEVEPEKEVKPEPTVQDETKQVPVPPAEMEPRADPAPTPAASPSPALEAMRSRLEEAEARYGQEDEAQERFSTWLLQGWTMTAVACPAGCSMPLMRSRSNQMWCPSCNHQVLTQDEYTARQKVAEEKKAEEAAVARAEIEAAEKAQAAASPRPRVEVHVPSPTLTHPVDPTPAPAPADTVAYGMRQQRVPTQAEIQRRGRVEGLLDKFITRMEKAEACDAMSDFNEACDASERLYSLLVTIDSC